MTPPKLVIKSLSSIKQNPSLPRVGEALDDVASGTSNLAAQLSSDPGGSPIIPAQVSGVQVQHVGNGQIDIAITDNSQISRAVNYFVDYSADSSMANPYILPMGPARNNHTLVLPDGNWYFQGYSQYPAGGPPSAPVRLSSPIVVSGSSSGSFFPSQGSGTGKPSTGGGQGAGKVVSR